MQFRSDVLPAPFGPIIECIVPFRTSKLTLSNTLLLPKLSETFCTLRSELALLILALVVVSGGGRLETASRLGKTSISFSILFVLLDHQQYVCDGPTQ